MSTILDARLVNDPFGDPGVHVDVRTEGRTLLFDLGDNATLAPGRLLRVSHAFVSHAHMDHFIGLDRLVRACLGRPDALRLYGPPEFVVQVGRRLAGYTWDRVAGYEADLVVEATEIAADGATRAARFRTSTGFAPEPADEGRAEAGVLVDEPAFRVRCALVDHRTPCLGFLLEEKPRLHLRRERLEALGLRPGPWIAHLKAAALAGTVDMRIRVGRQHAPDSEFALGELRHLLDTEPGRRIGYVTDVAYHRENVERIVALVRAADLLFIESVFLDADAGHGQRKQHLTARQAGTIARLAGVKQVVPFHFSPRYAGRVAELRAELEAAWRGSTAEGS